MQLSPREAFRTHLSGAEVAAAEEEIAERVWQVLGWRTLSDCLHAHLRVVVLGLAEVFESFPKVMLGQHGIDPLHRVPQHGALRLPCIRHTVQRVTAALPQHHAPERLEHVRQAQYPHEQVRKQAVTQLCGTPAPDTPAQQTCTRQHY